MQGWKFIADLIKYQSIIENLNDHYLVKNLVTICSDPYEAAAGAYAIVVLTEWDEFKVIKLSQI